MNEKTCTQCKVSKPLEDFGPEKRGKYGRRSKCRECMRENTRAYESRPDVAKRKKERRDRWYEENPDYNRRYYEENREHINELNRTWKIANPDYMPEYLAKYLPEYNQRPERKEANRIKSANRRAGMVGELPKDCMAILISRYGERCMNPDCDGTDSILTIDHVRPVSKGGTNTMDNVQILCYTCNRRKGNRNSNDYRPTD